MTLKKEFFVLGLVSVLAGCGQHSSQSSTQPPETAATDSLVSTPRVAAIDPLTLALMPQEGDSKTDLEIRRYQALVQKGQNREVALERLGWLFVAKARESFDPGYYKIASACADVLDGGSPGGSQALLLHGCVLENLHHFKEAEALAHQLVDNRGMPFDYGLLGDSLMEQGRLDEAVPVYQKMIDLRPDLESYSRVAHIRWLKGDTEGAIGMMQAAVSASSPSDPDPAAWACTQLAILQFQTGDSAEAQSAVVAALDVCSNYPPALLLRGRMALADNNPQAAVESLQIAAKANPLPDYQWTLAEALRAADREPEATALEDHLRKVGSVNDPRTFSLFLATHSQDIPTAVRLAQAELLQRQDVFTHDALAWALAASGRILEARQHMALAVAEGTRDGRLFFHAAVIAHMAGQDDEAQQWFTRAADFLPSLLPSEQARLHQLAEDFPSTNKSAAFAPGNKTPSTILTMGN